MPEPLSSRITGPDDIDLVTRTITLAFADDPVWGPAMAADRTNSRVSGLANAFNPAVLRLISHAPMRWRVVVLATLALVVALLVSRSSGPPAPAAPLAPPTATLDQLIAEPLPGGLSPALLQPRDSALAARGRAQQAGAMKNSVPALALAEAALQNAERGVRVGDLAQATSSYLAKPRR